MSKATVSKDDPARELVERMRDRPQHDRDVVAMLIERAARALDPKAKSRRP